MKSEYGQGIMEYACILLLLAALFFAVLIVLGPQISTLHGEIMWQMGWSDSRPMSAAEAARELYLRQQEQEYEEMQDEARTLFADLPFSDHCYSGKHVGWDCSSIAEAFDKGLDGGCIPLRKDCPVAQNKVVFYCEPTPGTVIGMVISTVNDVVITAFQEDRPGYWANESCGGH